MRSILDAAENLIVKGGLDALTTSAVAKRAGMPVGTLYQYFADREEIIATLVDHHLEAMNARIIADLSSVETLTVRAMVESAMRSHAAFYRDRPSFVKMWFQGRLSPAIVAKQRRRNIELAKWLRLVADQFSMIDESAPELGGWFVVEVGDRILEMAFRRDPNGDDEIIEEGIEMIVSYLDRFATPVGRKGKDLTKLPKLMAGDDE